MSSAAFIALAQTMLSKKDLHLMMSLGLCPEPVNEEKEDHKGPAYAKAAEASGCKFVDKWRAWDRALRLHLAKHRAAKTEQTITDMVDPPFFPYDANQTALRAVSNDLNPLEGELVIDRARWTAIDSLAGTSYFDRNNVFAYYLKILLLERRQSFNVEKGFAEYKSLYASIVESAHKSLGEPK
jgi:hypothetical protein